MGLFGDLGGFLGSVGVPFAQTIGNGLDSLTGSPLASGVMGYVGQQDTNSANAAIHASDNAFNAEQAAVNRTWSAEQAQKQMDFQSGSQAESERYNTEMSNTQWQRGVKDMEAAGLSPMLAYMKGGASAPSVSAMSGSMGQSSAASAASPISMGNAISAGLSSANMAADTANKLATKGLIEAQTSATVAGEGLTNAQAAVAVATADSIKAATENIPIEGKRLGAALNLLEQQRQNLVKEGYNITDQGNVLRATLDKLGSENLNLKELRQQIIHQATLSGLDVDAARSLGNLGRQVGEFKPLFDILRSLFRR